MPHTRHIAVFGDLHGYLRLMLQLCRIWQKKHRAHLDGVLQCGDLGFFPEMANVDQATRRYARREPEELAFMRYFKLPEPLEADKLVLSALQGPQDHLQTVRCPITWCHGNHEDFKELERILGDRPLAPVDAYGKFELLRSGHMTEVADLRIAAIGGAPETENYDDYTSRWSQVSESACERVLDELEKSNQTLDILLTHASASGSAAPRLESGSRLLSVVIELARPAYHFYSHHGRPRAPCRVGDTQCYWLNDTKFERRRHDADAAAPLKQGCMGILTWEGPGNHSFEVLEEAWLKEVNSANWRYL